MKRIKDLSKAIGIVGRGGRYFPSNEKSQEKISRVERACMGFDCVADWDRRGLELFKAMARGQGYTVIVIERGLNR